MVRINVAALKQGAHALSLQPEASTLALDPDMFSNIRVALHLNVQADGHVVAALEAQALAHLRCDRTLAPFDLPIAGRYTVLFVPPDEMDSEDAACDEVQVLLPSEPFIDLTEVVHDTLMLALPVRRLAPGAEEVALSLQFGGPDATTPETDPRWDAHRKLHPHP
jgi:uncharacterized protein